MKILIICTGNSCRSQMAHGFLESFDTRLHVRSAGTDPGPKVNVTAIEVMKESGIDISRHKPEPIDLYLNEPWDYVITVCDDANDNCPFFPGKVMHRLHMGFVDPSKATGSIDYIMGEFRRIRDEIRETFHRLYTEQILPELNR